MIKIFTGTNASSLEITAVNDLKTDLGLVLDEQVEIVSHEDDGYKFSIEDLNIVVGSPNTNEFISTLCLQNLIPITSTNPGKRGGCVHVINDPAANSEASLLILAGSDDQGAQYSVYDFASNDLRIDPFRYWTDSTPPTFKSIELKNIQSRIIPPPLVPILAYFDNDNDELANLTKPYLEFSLEHWKELINSLVRLKYNAIDIHDHLGRAEFYRWDHYKKLRPGYKVNEDLLNRIIDYAHDRGVMIQVSFYMGWQFKPIKDKESLNWRKYKSAWISTWEYYLKHTPIGKCDIFLNRPRDQRWDRVYRGIGKPAEIFNDAFPEMVKVIKAHNPEAIIIADLYSEGRKVFEQGFRPKPKSDYVISWPDNGFGKFEYMPITQDGYKFGIYMHAGFYLNHLIHDPYPHLLDKEMKKAYLEHGMTHYCLVNGQQFRHYLLNLEVCSKLSDQPQTFNIDEFMKDWCIRYFGEEDFEHILQVLDILHKVQVSRYGYISLLYKITYMLKHPRLAKLLRFLPKKLIQTIGKRFMELGKPYLDRLTENISQLELAIDECRLIQPKSEHQKILFHDLIELQVRLLLQLNKIAYNIQLWTMIPKEKKYIDEAIKLVEEHTKTRLKGDLNPRWRSWYDPKTTRPNGGYPDIQKLRLIAKKR